MNKNLLPILLLAGAAVAFLSFRRRPRVTVTAESPEIQTREQFEKDQAAPSFLDKASDVIKNVFTKPPQRKAAAQAQRRAVQLARQKGQSVKAVKAVTKKLATEGLPRFRGFDDIDVLC